MEALQISVNKNVLYNTCILTIRLKYAWTKITHLFLSNRHSLLALFIFLPARQKLSVLWRQPRINLSKFIDELRQITKSKTSNLKVIEACPLSREGTELTVG